ncbi:YggS family pyridoxal phosphate enzyme [Capronia coronata CBS 617.96]|uniref:Pyridoxal phosphate homeostasis protein n=1 Tax=Capronia coronata CBS 617.96 TaxID=1182541 RepID=W9YUM7_9EURO|nr:YggS family pyridoxal phosphate enzyme [Capronia coronata CBS 617.96]EXJ96228.1 YggS family pyridoxal phosphate enzyme [Capronia coronata CBS 617.96]
MSNDKDNDDNDNHHTSTDSMPSGSMIKIDPARAAVLQSNLQSVQQRISAVLSSQSQSQPQSTSSSTSASTSSTSHPPPRLVAVSKLKPASDILALHSPPTHHLHFGENYVQELLEKARLLPKTIKWHFIGGLQSNKATQLAREVESLWAVESVDSQDPSSSSSSSSKPEPESESESESVLHPDPLRVFIQVNTSGEDSKSGVSPIIDSSSSETQPDTTSELINLATHIRSSCPNLHLQGLMTIGAIARSKATTAETENEDFICLRDTRDRLARALGVEPAELELSMGMSEDFEGAIRQGSAEVRVGSTIFGERPAKKDAKVV